MNVYDQPKTIKFILQHIIDGRTEKERRYARKSFMERHFPLLEQNQIDRRLVNIYADGVANAYRSAFMMLLKEAATVREYEHVLYEIDGFYTRKPGMVAG